MIYFDHAATTPLDKSVFEAMTPYFTETFGNPDSVHGYGRRAMRGVDTARDEIARLLSCKASEIYFTASGSESNTWAIKSAVQTGDKKKKHILVSAIEHHSVLNAAAQLEKEGVEVDHLPVDEEGVLSLDALERAVRRDTALVAVMAGNNETGVLQPLEKIAPIAKRYGALLHCDCVQTAGLYDLPVGLADTISFSAHKFYGPKGVGCLYIRNGTAVRPLVNGGEQERGVRGGTTNVPGVVGMAMAVSMAQREKAETRKKIKSLRDAFERALEEDTPSIRINGKGAERLVGISNVTFFGAEGTALLFRLDLKGIAVSLGSACASGSIGASHVLTAMGRPEREALSSVRFSFGKENTMEEVRFAVQTIKEILSELKS